METEAISPRLIRMVNYKLTRKLLAKKIDGYIYKSIVSDDSEDLQQVRLKRYQYLSAMLHCVVRNVDKGYISKEFIKKIINVLVQNNLVGEDQSANQAVEKFEEKYGEPPPSFIVLSPTQICNLKCTGCYASSAANTPAAIPYPYVDRGYISKEFIKKIINVLVQNNLIGEDQSANQAVEKFKEKYGEPPPSFIVLSPTQICNLKCTGCYASSAANTPATIPYSYVDRIVSEVHDSWGSRFITISGGEPFMYRSEGKTLLDIYQKYNDMFFLAYTNGTVINEEVAQRLAKSANITPAISVEGFEEETDNRRGAGTHKKILHAFECLRQAGVPFGISVTATSKNVDTLLTDEFYDFYFQEQGACYMWQFQLMPIGRGKDEIDLMVKPEQRIQLFRKWEKLLSENRYCIADFWNSGVLTRGCIAYGRNGGYLYIDWHGNVTPCTFIPYYVDNIYDLYNNGKTLSDALFSDFMKNGRKWQREYGFDNWKKPKNWLMPCSIRDHYEIFRNSVLPKDAKPEDEKAKEALESDEYFEVLKKFDEKLETLTEKIWETEYLNV